MIINPNCPLPWEIYLDYLADQGHDDLRHVDCAGFISLSDVIFFSYNSIETNFWGGITSINANGDGSEDSGLWYDDPESGCYYDEFGSDMYCGRSGIGCGN